MGLQVQLTLSVYFANFLAMGVYVGCKGPLLLTLADRTGAPVAAMGAIFTSFSAGQLTAACISGWVVDHGRGHIGLAAALVLAAGGAAAMPLAGSFWQLLVSTALQGVGVGFMDAGGDVSHALPHP